MRNDRDLPLPVGGVTYLAFIYDRISSHPAYYSLRSVIPIVVRLAYADPADTEKRGVGDKCQWHPKTCAI